MICSLSSSTIITWTQQQQQRSAAIRKPLSFKTYFCHFSLWPQNTQKIKNLFLLDEILCRWRRDSLLLSLFLSSFSYFAFQLHAGLIYVNFISETRVKSNFNFLSTFVSFLLFAQTHTFRYCSYTHRAERKKNDDKEILRFHEQGKDENFLQCMNQSRPADSLIEACDDFRLRTNKLPSVSFDFPLQQILPLTTNITQSAKSGAQNYSTNCTTRMEV